ncbi:serine hydrolase domain-containing protein [Amycolatopsis magusensis]|uniref:D-alanyl-D-alanine carboxypeptidase n=1 Tax=Amycolatopsis magusensis TaxID=882444 RepID=A0ABS4PQK6_9PSEU|nr:serine hydrolase domain-containing protein [Amycolatopsis magusensis]MBP2181701.1 D-alanyl-D-alanine carboxypeptidase [Amycolatopsis magusensis]
MKFLRHLALGAAIVLTGSAATTGAAHAATPAEILRAGAELGVSQGYPGVIGLVRTGETTERVSAGWGDQFMRVPADPRAKYRIGSNTKAFVATVLLQLTGEGRLSLDDPVAKWLPGAVARNGNDGTKISVRQLLNHTSGLADYIGDARVAVPYVADLNPGKLWPPQTLVDIATDQAPVGAPGQKYSYANTNYVLAGMVIKAVTGAEAAAEVHRRIIEPLGLSGTTFPVSDPKLYGNWLHGYFFVRDISFSSVQITGAAGAMVSTMDDLAKFERALVAGELLAPAQQAELKTTVPVDATSGYGLGIVSVQLPCGRAWTHSGAVLGYFNSWLTSDDGSKQVLVAANEYHLLGGTPAQAAIGEAAADAYCAR